MFQTEIILGNIFSLCAMVSDSISGTRKKHKQIMAVQIVSQFFYAASSIALKGYSSTAQNAVAVLRNLAAMKNVKSKVLEWALILAGVVLGIILNNRGLLGWLPIVANLEYSIAVFQLKNNEKALKLAFIINMIMYAVFNVVILNYVGVASCLVVSITTAISLIKTIKNNDLNSPETDGREKMKVINFFDSDRKEYWIEEIRKSDWRAGAFLSDLLSKGTFFESVGDNSRVLLLTDGDNLVSYCTFAEKDDIQPTDLTPWIGFVYTFPQYRGHRYAGKLFEEAERIAKDEGFKEIYLSTNHINLYEKYGFEYMCQMTDMDGAPSRIYVKKVI